MDGGTLLLKHCSCPRNITISMWYQTGQLNQCSNIITFLCAFKQWFKIQVDFVFSFVPTAAASTTITTGINFTTIFGDSTSHIYIWAWLLGILVLVLLHCFLPLFVCCSLIFSSLRCFLTIFFYFKIM